MNIDNIKKRISEKKIEQISDDDYSIDFFDKLSEISCIDDESKIDSLIRNMSSGFTGYYQSIAEIIIWFHCNKLKIPFSTNVKMKHNSKKNIDLSCVYNNINLNFEIKCPNIYDSFDGKTRLVIPEKIGDENNKDSILSQVREIKEKLPFIDEIKLPKNNTLCDCLGKANEQFGTSSTNDYNVLLLETTTQDTAKYLSYLEDMWNGEKMRQEHTFSNVDAVIVSNIISINMSHRATAWDIDSATNILFTNPNSMYANDSSRKNSALFDFLPISNNEYYTFVFFHNYYKRNGRANHIIGFNDYIYQKKKQ